MVAFELVHVTDVCYVADVWNTAVETVVESCIDRCVYKRRSAYSVKVVYNQNLLIQACTCRRSYADCFRWETLSSCIVCNDSEAVDVAWLDCCACAEL